MESEDQLDPQNRDTVLVKAMGFFMKIVVFSDLDMSFGLEAGLLLNCPTGFGKVHCLSVLVKGTKQHRGVSEVAVAGLLLICVFAKNIEY